MLASMSCSEDYFLHSDFKSLQLSDVLLLDKMLGASLTLLVSLHFGIFHGYPTAFHDGSYKRILVTPHYFTCYWDFWGSYWSVTDSYKSKDHRDQASHGS